MSKKYKPLESDSPSMASEPACTYNNQVKAKTQRQMVKDSLTRAFDDLHSGKVHHDARKLFMTNPR